MAWLIAAFVFVVPLVFFPRAAAYILAAAVVVLGGWALYEWTKSARTSAEEDKIAITAGFDPATCGAAKPLKALVVNGSGWPVSAVRFDISVKHRGYGNEIGRLSRLLEDEPLVPGAQSQFCYALPVLIPPVGPEELEFSIPLKFVTFQ